MFGLSDLKADLLFDHWFCHLLAMYFLANFLTSPKSGRILMSVVCFAVASFAKESACSLPLSPIWLGTHTIVT